MMKDLFFVSVYQHMGDSLICFNIRECVDYCFYRGVNISSDVHDGGAPWWI
jgi:hypothetical protein